MEKIKAGTSALKILAACLALVMWFYVTYGGNPSVDFWVRGVPITITGLSELADSSLGLVKLSRASIDIKVSSPRLSISYFNNKTVSASVDLSGVRQTGEIDLPVSVSLPQNGGTLVKKKFNAVAAVVEKLSLVRLPVSGETVGEAAAGFEAEPLAASLDPVEIRGAQSLVKKISRVTCDAVDISGASQAVKTSKRIFALDKDGNVIDNLLFSANPADVTVTVYQIKTVPVVIETKGRAQNPRLVFSVTSDAAEITVKGLPADVEKITEIKTAPVDLSELDGDAKLSVPLELPENVYVHDGGSELSVTVSAEVAAEEAGQ